MSVPSGRPLGLSVASHSGLAPAAVGELAASAEAAGFSAVFVAEGHGDALSLCHPVIAATRQARVGTAVANAALRPPVLAAKTAAQLDQASGGRFLLGLGVANEVMNSRFGLPSVPAPADDRRVRGRGARGPGGARSMRAALPGRPRAAGQPAGRGRCRSTWPRSGRACWNSPGVSPTASSSI